MKEGRDGGGIGVRGGQGRKGDRRGLWMGKWGMAETLFNQWVHEKEGHG